MKTIRQLARAGHPDAVAMLREDPNFDKPFTAGEKRAMAKAALKRKALLASLRRAVKTAAAAPRPKRKAVRRKAQRFGVGSLYNDFERPFRGVVKASVIEAEARRLAKVGRAKRTKKRVAKKPAPARSAVAKARLANLAKARRVLAKKRRAAAAKRR